MPPSLTDHMACSGLELLSWGELLTNPAAVADVLVLNDTKHRHALYYVRKAWVKTLVRPLPSLWS
jgi:hypothetical protein